LASCMNPFTHPSGGPAGAGGGKVGGEQRASGDRQHRGGRYDWTGSNAELVGHQPPGPAAARNAKRHAEEGGEQREGVACQATVWETWPRTKPRVMKRVWAERCPYGSGREGRRWRRLCLDHRDAHLAPEILEPRRGQKLRNPAPVPVPAGGTGGGCWPHCRHRCVPVEGRLSSHLGPGGHGRSRT
jgi:hypothetical protein